MVMDMPITALKRTRNLWRFVVLAFGTLCLLTLPAHSAIADQHSTETSSALKKDKTAPLSAEELRQLEGEFVLIPAGRFLMGSDDGRKEEKPALKVDVPAFLMATTEVTFDQWEACIADGGCTHYPDDVHYGRGQKPVINVSYIVIVHQFIPWLSSKTGFNYRLPTEAEWEYAARAGTETVYPWGNTASKEYANYGYPNTGRCFGSEQDKSNSICLMDVKSFPANQFGLYDMLGNVREVTEGCWVNNLIGAPTDGSARKDGDCYDKPVKGGSWLGDPSEIRPAFRTNHGQFSNSWVGGFRLVKEK